MERSANARGVTRLPESGRYDAKAVLLRVFGRLYPARLGRYAELPQETMTKKSDSGRQK